MANPYRSASVVHPWLTLLKFGRTDHRGIGIFYFHAGDFAGGQLNGEVHPGQQTGGVEPLLTGIRIAGWLLLAIQGLAELRHLIDERESEIDIAIDGADGAGYHLERRLHLRPEGAFAPEFSRIQHGFHYGAQVAVGLPKGLSHTVDETFGRNVRHEPLRELSRNEVGCGRMARHDIEHLLAILDAAAGGNRDAK